MTRVNPDKDAQPAEIFNASETMGAVYSPEGASLASIRTERTTMLLQGHWHTTIPQQGHLVLTGMPSCSPGTCCAAATVTQTLWMFRC